MTTLPTFTLSAGFQAQTGTSYMFFDVAGHDVFDTNTFAPDVILHDITSYAREGVGLTITRGVQNIVTTGFGAQAGVLHAALDNRDRRFDPAFTTGAYADSGVSKVLPNVAINLFALYNATGYDVFYGYADGWPQSYPAYGRDAVVDLQATDGTQFFANSNLQITRPAEQTGERIAAIVAATGWVGVTAIATGDATVPALTRGSVSAWSHMVDCANAEWGDLYFSNNGTLTFRSRDQIFSQSRSVTSQATFGDAGTELRYSDMQRGTAPIVNRVVLTWSDTGSQVTADDSASQDKYGLQAVNLQLAFSSAAQAQQHANWLIARYSTPVETFASITIRPARGAGVTSGANNLFPQAFGRELGDRITVKFTPLTGSRLTADVFIRGISHTYQDGVWRETKFTLQDASWTSTLIHFDSSLFDDGSVFGL